ncbi:MAG: methionyl-tRNA formyltransferase [Phycisphaerales bacterium]
MDLVYFGSGGFGLPTLAALAQRHTIWAVVTQPDRPAGRGGALTPTPVAQWAAEHLAGVPVLKPEDVNEAGACARVRGAPAAAWVVIAYGQKLGRALLDGRFATNLHASLLPRWRGAAPVAAAILAGDAETGNSVITLAERMDAGLVLGQSRRALDPDLTAGELAQMLAQDGPALVLDVLARHEQGTLEGTPQDEAGVTLAPKLSKGDGTVDLSRPAAECRARVHGLTPWPGVAVKLGGVELKLWRVQLAGGGSDGVVPGTLVDVPEGLVACGAGTLLRLVEVQPAGKRRMGWGEFIRGHKVAPRERLVSARGGQDG